MLQQKKGCFSKKKGGKKEKIESKKTPICGELVSFLADFPRKRQFSIPREKILPGEFAQIPRAKFLEKKSKNTDLRGIDQLLGELGGSETDALITQHRCCMDHRDTF